MRTSGLWRRLSAALGERLLRAAQGGEPEGAQRGHMGVTAATIASGSGRLARIRERQESLAEESRAVDRHEIEQVHAQLAVLCTHFDDLAAVGETRPRLVQGGVGEEPPPRRERGGGFTPEQLDHYFRGLFREVLPEGRFLHLPGDMLRDGGGSYAVGRERVAEMALGEDGTLWLRLERLQVVPATGAADGGERVAGAMAIAARVEPWSPELLPAGGLAATLDRVLGRIERRQGALAQSLAERRLAADARQRRLPGR